MRLKVRAVGLGLAGALAGSAALASVTLPARRPGLWVTTSAETVRQGERSVGGLPLLSALCSDARIDAIETAKLAGAGPGCGPMDIEGAGATYTLTAACPDPHGGTIRTRATFTYTGDTAVHIQSDTDAPHIAARLEADSKWVGACPAGVQPGDIGSVEDGKFVKLGTVLGAAP